MPGERIAIAVSRDDVPVRIRALDQAVIELPPA